MLISGKRIGQLAEREKTSVSVTIDDVVRIGDDYYVLITLQ